MIPKYRIKTEEEFKKDNGYWFGVPSGWAPNMKYLYGLSLQDVDNKQIRDLNILPYDKFHTIGLLGFYKEGGDGYPWNLTISDDLVLDYTDNEIEALDE